MPKSHFALWKEFLTILEFASLQIQNSPFGLRHWICGRFASLRMVSKNSFMFAPGISATTRCNTTCGVVLHMAHALRVGFAGRGIIHASLFGWVSRPPTIWTSKTRFMESPWNCEKRREIERKCEILWDVSVKKSLYYYIIQLIDSIGRKMKKAVGRWNMPK